MIENFLPFFFFFFFAIQSYTFEGYIKAWKNVTDSILKYVDNEANEDDNFQQ